jgi:Na+/H+-dicarboxylate symporter
MEQDKPESNEKTPIIIPITQRKRRRRRKYRSSKWLNAKNIGKQLKNHNNIQLLATFLGVIVGLIVGILLNLFSKPSESVLELLHLPGDLLLRMLNCLIVPLVVTSMVTSINSLGDVRKAGRIGLYAVVYYIITTVFAVTIGLIMVNVLQPGRRGGEFPIEPIPHRDDPRCPKASNSSLDNVLAIFRDAFPSNLVDAASNEILCHLNILGLIVFSLVFGGVLSTMGEEGEPVRRFFDSLNKAIMRLVFLVIWYAPVGICFLIIWRLAKERHLKNVIQQLGFFILTVFAGLGVHSLIVIPLIYLIFVRKNPLKHLFGLSSALMTALGTSSSSATMPLTMRCCENNLGLNTQVINFMIPLGATINMDGTALYEAVAAVFIAQSLNIKLNIASMIMIAFTATLASIGAAGIPEAGLVTMIMVVESVGLPVEGIGLILAVDWFLDRFRTMVNVWGDTVGVAVVDKLLSNKLDNKGLLISQDNKDNDLDEQKNDTTVEHHRYRKFSCFAQ